MLYIICASFDDLGQKHAFANPEQSRCLWPEESLLEVDSWRDLCHETAQFQLTDPVLRRFSLCLLSSALLCFCWSDNQGTQHVDVSVVRQACGAVRACPAVTAGYPQSLELEQKHHGQLQHVGGCTFDRVSLGSIKMGQEVIVYPMHSFDHCFQLSMQTIKERWDYLDFALSYV